MKVRIGVTLKGFEDEMKLLRKLAKEIPGVLEEANLAFANATIDKLKEKVAAGKILPGKRRSNGKPTLVDSGKYLAGYRARKAGNNGAVVEVIGQNDQMSNEALQQVLEFGGGGRPARPHVRLLEAWVRQTYTNWMKRRIDLELNRRGA